VLAGKLGLDAHKLYEIASQSSGNCWALRNVCPVPGPVPTSPANRDFQPGFTAAMMLKDLKLARTAARTTGAKAPMVAGAVALYDLFVEHDNGGFDFSAIIKLLNEN
jgi:3-hydroxyisobutyrate dehydrogenase